MFSKGNVPDGEQLAWIWAYRQALALMDRFDAEGLCQAEAGESGWDLDAWSRFLKTYGLRRGRQAELGDKGSRVFMELVPIFKPPVSRSDAVRDLNKRWARGTTAIGRLVAKKKLDGSDPELWAMSSKILWFYQPQMMTMYDDYARKGLAYTCGIQIYPSNYLSEFAKLYKRNEQLIKSLDDFATARIPFHVVCSTNGCG